MRFRTVYPVPRVNMVWGIVVLTALATLLFAACGGTTATQPTSPPTATTAPTAPTTPTAQASPTSAPASTIVHVQIVEHNGQYAFQPATITIRKGTQIVWTNGSDAPHTVTSDTGAFTSSSTVTPQQTYMLTFNTAGTFTYHCSIHPYMKATITVTA